MHGAAIDACVHALPRLGLKCLGSRECKGALMGGGHEGAGERVFTGGFSRGGEGQKIVFGDA